ncbi:MAG: DUF1330 domain-containing protein [Bacillota bacterium]
MAAYAIACVQVHDWERYKQYIQRTPAVIAKYGGKFIVRGGEAVTLEGAEETPRVIVIEFPSLAQAKTFYNSKEYQEVRKLRIGAATASFIAVEGCSAD